MIRPLTCPIGQFCGSEVTIEPVACPADQIADFEGASICYPCESGFIANEDRTQCIACAAGEYELEGVCRPCLDGTYSQAAGSAECLTCPSGFVNEAKTFCEPSCPAGHIRKASIPEVIENEVLAIYIACEPCPRGFFQSGNECLPCDQEANQYNQYRGQNQCTVCAGRVFDDAKQCFDSSSICPPGHYNNGFNCIICPAGTYQPFENSDDRCLPAGFGFYCPEEGMENRKDCDAGFYCPNEYVVEPLICPAGYKCPIRTRNPLICNAPEDETCRYSFVLVNNEVGQSECDYQCFQEEQDQCTDPQYHIRVLIQEDGTIRPEREFSGDLCINSAVFEWGKAPIVGQCQADKFFGQWEYNESTGAIYQWKAACQARENGCTGAKTQMCWTVKTMGLDRRVTLDTCRIDCTDVMVAHQRFIYQKGRVRMVDTDFCVAWYPSEKFLKLTDCKFDIFG